MAVPPLVPLGAGVDYCVRCYALLPGDPFSPTGRGRCMAACPKLGPVDDVLAVTYLTWYPRPQRIGSDIYYMKEKNERQHIPDLAAVLHRYLDNNGECIEGVWRPTVATYVPASKERVARRGFDHMKEIVSMRPDNMRRFGITPLLKQLREEDLPSEDRRVNPRDWRVLKGVDVTGERVLVIDDTLTSGTTAASIAETLREQGAANVYLLVIARAIFKGDYDAVLADVGPKAFDWKACKLRAGEQ